MSKGVRLSKLTTPDVDAAYPRTQLFSQLTQARNKSAIWISAPAGAGKTMLVASYLQSEKVPCLWYQLDSGDSDASSFFYYLGLAVKKVASKWRKAMPLLTPEYHLDPTVFARNYFRELYSRLDSPFTLVLDNYQELPDNALLHELLKVGIEEIPTGINIIVMSRSFPPAVMSRLITHELIKEFSWNDLKLSLLDSQEIIRLRTADDSLSLADMEVIHKNSYGWMAGLILLLEQHRNGNLLIDNLTVVDDLALENESYDRLFEYFSSEVFSQTDSKTQVFLLKTAWLKKITVHSAKKISEIASSKRILSELVRRQFFITKRGMIKPVFDYHPLFQNYLRAKACEQFDDETLKQLQHCSAALLLEMGQLEEAVSLYQTMKNWPAVIAIIEKHAAEYLKQGRYATIERWIEQLPVCY